MTLERLPEDMGRWVSVLVPASQLAERIAGTEFVPKPMRGKPDVVTAAIMYGDELGVGPMQALAGIHVVEGRPQPSAELMRGLILRAGHSIAVHEMTGTRCRVSGLRAGRPEAERVAVDWSLDMAKAAGLLGKTNWRSYPRAMLLARATSDLARLLFPDVVKGLGYVVEDVESAAQLEAWAPDPEPDRPPVAPPAAVPQRRRKPSLPSPGHRLATEDHPGPDGSVDVPLPEDPETRDPGPVDSPAAEAPGRAQDNDDYRPEVTPDEPPAEGAEAAPKPMGEAPFKALQASLTEVLGRAPRDERLAAVGAVIGREIATSKDLTRDEGYRALGFLERVKAGTAGLVKRDGAWRAVVYDEPPTDPWADDQTEGTSDDG